MHTWSPRDERRRGGLDVEVGERAPQPQRVALERVHAAQRVRAPPGPRSSRRACSTTRSPCRPSRARQVSASSSIGPRASSLTASARPRPPRARTRARSGGAGCAPRARASKPASTALRIAAAMATGSAAREIALASSTASQPASIASAASEAVPTPASRITGTRACSTISRRLYGLLIPMPLPIGDPSGITAAQPASSRRRARIGSSFVYGRHREALAHERLGRLEQLGRVGEQRPVVADHLELHPVGARAPRAPAARWSRPRAP